MYETSKKRKGPIRRWTEQSPFLFLTIGLLVILVCMPFAVSKLSRFIFVELTFVLVMGVGISATGHRRWFIKWVVGLWALSTSLDVLAYMHDAERLQTWLDLINQFSSLIFLIFCTAFLLRHIFEAENITIDSVFAATSSYVLLTMIWAFAYTIILTFSPDAFSFSNSTEEADWLKMVYFSMVTITTLGYGDISPVSSFARMLAGVEALVGQLYLAVLIAWLVGLTISERQLRKRRD